MATHPYIDRICAAAMAFALALTLLLANGEALGLQAAGSSMGYEARLFDSERVHTIDIVMDDWDEFIENCENEEYQLCSLVIDGEAKRNAAIRAKGNTSLTQVAAYGNDRYSFKIEFDRYDSSNTYYGLDKLSLNNLIQDNSLMKDFLVYQLMGQFGVAAPLCSYVFITVNGEPWGLYLAVEGIEDAFLQRNYGSNAGELYKPDSMSFGGGRGNGGGFHMDEMMENFEPMEKPQDGGQPQMDLQGGGPGGMGSSDVKLQYIDDSLDSYPNIFDNAKTDITDADKARLIASLKALSSGEEVDSAVDAEQVIRYFVVHGFVCNGDSYTGSMVHNYYLYEKDGKLSMLPWDYNLAFGGFQSNDASGAVNEPIDTPVSNGNLEDRPMAAWIFNDESYTTQYHQYYDEFLTEYLESGVCEALICKTADLISSYVADDPTKFCTSEEFQTGVEALKTFCRLRAQSVRGQLDGTIPSTTQGQSEDRGALVDCTGLNLADMGSMGMGGGMGGPGGRGSFDPAQEGTNEPPKMPDAGEVPAFAPDQEGGGRFPGGEMGGPPPSGSGVSGVLPLGVSVIVLAAGLAFAGMFRRRR